MPNATPEIYVNHFIQRVKQRYGLNLTIEDCFKMAEDIRQGKSIMQGKSSKTRTKHIVVHNYKFLKVVYSKSLKCLVTALPLKVV